MIRIPQTKIGRSPKLSSPWTGPHTVIEKTGTTTYKVTINGNTKTINSKNMKRYHGNNKYPTSKEIDIQRLQITEILGRRKVKSGRKIEWEYHVRWNNEDIPTSWETEENTLAYAPELIAEYEEAHPKTR